MVFDGISHSQKDYWARYLFAAFGGLIGSAIRSLESFIT
jgi:hypothetical protein